MKQIRSSAPTRIDLAGGTLDIWPLYLFHEHAQTLNAAISLRAHAEIIERTDGRIRLESIDTSKTVEVGALAGAAPTTRAFRCSAGWRVSSAPRT